MIVFSHCTLLVWGALKLMFPQIFRYLTEYFDQDFHSLTSEQKCDKLKIGFSVFSVLLFALILSMLAL